MHAWNRLMRVSGFSGCGAGLPVQHAGLKPRLSLEIVLVGKASMTMHGKMHGL
jgi:hypothetical protein